jgi:hypothetical protein
MLPSSPELKALKAQMQQLQIALFDPRELPQWPEWASWWYTTYGETMSFAQIVKICPELKNPATFKKIFSQVSYGAASISTEQFLAYKLRGLYAHEDSPYSSGSPAVGHRRYR